MANNLKSIKKTSEDINRRANIAGSIVSLLLKYIILATPTCLTASIILCYTRAHVYKFNFVNLMTYQDYINYSINYIPTILFVVFLFTLAPLVSLIEAIISYDINVGYYSRSYIDPTLNIDLRRLFFIFKLVPYCLLMFQMIGLYSRDHILQHHPSYASTVFGFALIAPACAAYVFFKKFYDKDFVLDILNALNYPAIFLVALSILVTDTYDYATSVLTHRAKVQYLIDTQSKQFVALEFLERGVVIYDETSKTSSFKPWEQISHVIGPASDINEWPVATPDDLFYK